MSKSLFLNEKDISSLEKNHKAVRGNMNAQQLAVAQESDEYFEEINKDVSNFESEARIRAAGFTQQQAEDIAYLIKTKYVGEIFNYASKQLVLTPFKTVVPAQTYLIAVQDRLLEVTSVPNEIEIAGLKKTIQEFTSLSFFGLIKLAVKRLFTTRNK